MAIAFIKSVETSADPFKIMSKTNLTKRLSISKENFNAVALHELFDQTKVLTEKNPYLKRDFSEKKKKANTNRCCLLVKD